MNKREKNGADEETEGEVLRTLLPRLVRGKDLIAAEPSAFSGTARTDAQIAAALIALAVKGETLDELTDAKADGQQRIEDVSRV